jgi:hypothetical protein
MSMLIKKHSQNDFFVADVFDNLPFKNDMASMEHPIFTLSLKPDRRTLLYQNGTSKIEVTPSIEGLPSIMDKDFLMYCGSLLIANFNEGREQDPEYLPPRTIRVSAHDYFKATQREDNGKSYEIFKKALIRLRSCTITTTIRTNGKKQLEGFGLIESFRVVESCRVKNRMVALEVTLSDWYYQSILGLEVLSLNRDYFLIRKPLERRLYEIARKHCGKQKEWFINLDNLFIKTGSSGTLAKFRFNLKTIINDDHIPDYSYALDSKDKVTISKKDYVEPIKLAPDANLHDQAFHILSQLKKATLANAKKIHEESYTDWSMQEIAIQYVQYMEKKGAPKTLDGSFLGFLKKKVKTFKKDSVTC